MTKVLSKKASWFKENHFTDEDELHVGVDVHKDRYNVSLWYDGRIGCVYSMSSDSGCFAMDVCMISTQ